MNEGEREVERQGGRNKTNHIVVEVEVAMGK